MYTGRMCRHKLEMSLLVDPHIAMFNADIGEFALFSHINILNAY